MTLYNASEAATGEKTATAAERREARWDLQKALYVTLGTLMTLYPRQPEMLWLYMQQSHLGGPASGPVPGNGEEEESSSSSSSVSSISSVSSFSSEPSSSSESMLSSSSSEFLSSSSSELVSSSSSSGV